MPVSGTEEEGMNWTDKGTEHSPLNALLRSARLRHTVEVSTEDDSPLGAALRGVPKGKAFRFAADGSFEIVESCKYSDWDPNDWVQCLDYEGDEWRLG